MSIQKKFANNVKRIRILKQLSQLELSHLSGLHRTYISDIESGNRNVSLNAVEKIASAFKVKSHELLM